jgi:multidrug transporter EmrE-like cation transporter
MSKTVVNVVLLVISIGLAVAGQLAMKAGMNNVTDNGENPLKVEDLKHPFALVGRLFREGPWAIGGIILYAISALFWLIVLSRVPLSVAYPIVAVGYVVVVLYSYFVFDEPVKWIAWVGLALIVAGVAITAQGLKSNKTDDGEAYRKPSNQAVSRIEAPDSSTDER